MTTHAELVERAVRWLHNTRKCAVVASERIATMCDESPDAIGWTARGHSILVECKVSMSDVYADKAKRSRVIASVGMGRERYYLTPPGLVPSTYQLADGWGLLEALPTRLRTRSDSKLFELPPSIYELRMLVHVTRHALSEFRNGITWSSEDDSIEDDTNLEQLEQVP